MQWPSRGTLVGAFFVAVGGGIIFNAIEGNPSSSRATYALNLDMNGDGVAEPLVPDNAPHYLGY